MEFASGDLINARYRLVDVIGRGGMGTVWRANDEMLDREVAIKEVRLPADLDEEERSELNAQAIREARATARLSHPGIVTIFDVIDRDGVPIIVMELIEGRSLAEILRVEVRLPYRRVAEIGAALLDALREAHAAGIVHRDLKPANILISDRRTVITDFGIAQRTGQPADPEEIIGTPSFMAPEQAGDAAASPAADLWALGATLFNAVEGRPPFQGQDAPAVLLTLLTQDAPAPRNAGPLAPLITALLRKDPALRPTADEAAAQLDAILHQPKPTPTTAGTRPVASSVRTPSKSATSPRPPKAPTIRSSSPPVPKPATRPPIRHVPSGRVLFIALLLGLFGLAGSFLFGMQFAPSGQSTAVSSGLPSVSPTSTGDIGINAFTAAAFSPDGATVAFGGSPGAVRLYDTSSHQFFRSVERPGGSGWTVESLEFSPDGKAIAVGFQDGADAMIWNIANKRERKLAGHGHLLRFGSHGQTLTTVDPKGTATVWTLRSSEHATDRIPTTVGCLKTALSQNGDEVACETGNTRVIVWNTRTHQHFLLQISNEDEIQSLEFTSNGRSLAVASVEGVHLFDTASHRKTADLAGYDSDVMAFSPDGRTLAMPARDATSWGSAVELWNLTTAKVVATLNDEVPVHDLEFSPDGHMLAIASDQGGQLWDTRSYKKLASW